MKSNVLLTIRNILAHTNLNDFHRYFTILRLAVKNILRQSQGAFNLLDILFKNALHGDLENQKRYHLG